VFNLANNSISSDGIREIFEVFKINTTLHALDLTGNKCIPEFSINECATFLNQNTTLHSLYLGGTYPKINLALSFNKAKMWPEFHDHIDSKCVDIVEQLFLLKSFHNSSLSLLPNELVHSVVKQLIPAWYRDLVKLYSKIK